MPELGADEERLLVECIRSTFVSSVGPFVTEFENRFAAYVGSPHAVACTNGTAAIHLALRALGIGRGDRVLVNDCTFIASANPAIYQGAEIGCIDSEPRSWNLDPALVDQALREWAPVKAVIAVHILGQPADLGPIVDACQRHGAALIEDAAEALGASYTNDYPHAACRGKQVGTIGAIGCFSFNGNKIMTTGGGGMATTANPELARNLKHLSTQAKLPGVGFQHDAVAYNYRMPNVNAALGLAQLGHLPAFLARKRAIAARYRELAAKLGLTHHPVLRGSSASEWLPSVLVPRRDQVMQQLIDSGMQARPVWAPLARQPALANARRWGGAIADRIAADGLSLPCSVGLTDAQQDRVLAALERACR
ncbi:MAG: aminotransferase class I/II-fold pyridoxal phosphate-dependent enzyme [Planctomycetota bacterium]